MEVKKNGHSKRVFRIEKARFWAQLADRQADQLYSKELLQNG